MQTSNTNMPDDETLLDTVGPHTVNPPDNVPKEVRDFIRLQNEIAGRETGEQIYMLTAEDIEEHYLDPDVLFKKLKKKNKRGDMKRVMEQLEEFIHAICHTYGKAVEVKELHHRVKTHMVAVLENMDKKTAAKMIPHVERYSAELNEAKDNISIYKKILRDMRNPNPAQIQQINEELEAEAAKITNIGNRFQKRVIEATAQTETAKPEPNLPSASHAPNIHTAMQDAATPHYHAPVSQAMPLRFSSASQQPGQSGSTPDYPSEAPPQSTEDLTDS